jgi:hypothetical protein
MDDTSVVVGEASGVVTGGTLSPAAGTTRSTEKIGIFTEKPWENYRNMQNT